MSRIKIGKVALNPKGNWVSTTTYEKLDMVISGGKTFVARDNVPVGTTTSTTTYWQQMVNSFESVTTTTVSASTGASASIIGTPDKPILSLQIPRGVSGNESIDDSAGEGDTDVVWSADKSYREINSISTNWGSITGNLQDQTDLKNALNAKVDTSIFDKIVTVTNPTNYGDVTTSDVVIGSSRGIGKVAVSSNPNGGLDFINSSGVNVAIGMALDDLDYETNKFYNVKITFTNHVSLSAAAVSLGSGMSAGHSGTVWYNLTQSLTDENVFTLQSLSMAAYNYASYGKLYMQFSLRYNQTAAVTAKLEIYEVGDEEKAIVKLSALEGIDRPNLSQDVNDLLDKIDDDTSVNHGILKASDLVVATSQGIGKVAVIEKTDGSVDLTNSSGYNVIAGFELNDIEYNSNNVYSIKVTITDHVSLSNIGLGLYRGMSEGHTGYSIYTFVQDPDDTNIFTISQFHIGEYDYTKYGKLCLGFSLRYNQTTSMNLKLEIYKIDTHDYPTKYEGKQICTFNKGLAIGDSLTAGVFNTNVGGVTNYVTLSNFSYPAKLEQLSGIEMTNLGNGGYTFAEWWDAHGNDDLSGNQFAIIQLGVNDALENSGWTPESETALTNIITKLQSENSGIFVFVATIIPATSYTGTAFDDVSDGIRTLVETLNDDHVILLDMAVYGSTRNAAGYNNGHLSGIGYERLALDYISYISYVISQNTPLFRNIQFIGTNYNYS